VRHWPQIEGAIVSSRVEGSIDMERAIVSMVRPIYASMGISVGRREPAQGKRPFLLLGGEQGFMRAADAIALNPAVAELRLADDCESDCVLLAG
jgi:hypothetical protein